MSGVWEHDPICFLWTEGSRKRRWVGAVYHVYHAAIVPSFHHATHSPHQHGSSFVNLSNVTFNSSAPHFTSQIHDDINWATYYWTISLRSNHLDNWQIQGVKQRAKKLKQFSIVMHDWYNNGSHTYRCHKLRALSWHDCLSMGPRSPM